MQSRWRRMPIPVKSEQGFSLVELLVGVGITTMIGTVIASLLATALSTQRSLQWQTDYHESLRLSASLVQQDARFANRAVCDLDYMKLYTSPSTGDYIMYKFASTDGVSETPDVDLATNIGNLHRWVFEGGVLQRDDIVGWKLVAPDLSGWTLGTEFGCESFSNYRRAFVSLIKPPLPGQTTGLQLRVMAMLR